MHGQVLDAETWHVFATQWVASEQTSVNSLILVPM